MDQSTQKFLLWKIECTDMYIHIPAYRMYDRYFEIEYRCNDMESENKLYIIRCERE